MESFFEYISGYFVEGKEPFNYNIVASFPLSHYKKKREGGEPSPAVPPFEPDFFRYPPNGLSLCFYSVVVEEEKQAEWASVVCNFVSIVMANPWLDLLVAPPETTDKPTTRWNWERFPILPANLFCGLYVAINQALGEVLLNEVIENHNAFLSI